MQPTNAIHQTNRYPSGKLVYSFPQGFGAPEKDYA